MGRARDLWNEVDGRSVPVCNGLVRDWSSWIRAQDENATAMAAALRALSPGAQDEVLEPGKLMRLSVEDPLDYPSVNTSTPVRCRYSTPHRAFGHARWMC